MCNTRIPCNLLVNPIISGSKPDVVHTGDITNVINVSWNIKDDTGRINKGKKKDLWNWYSNYLDEAKTTLVIHKSLPPLPFFLVVFQRLIFYGITFHTSSISILHTNKKFCCTLQFPSKSLTNSISNTSHFLASQKLGIEIYHDNTFVLCELLECCILYVSC